MKYYIQWFKIYADLEHKKFYKVFVFDDFEKMYKFMRKHAVACGDEYFEGVEDNYEGLCHSHAIDVVYGDGTRERYGDIGYILLHKKALTSGVISHECTHATTYYFGQCEVNKNIFEDCEADEKFASVQGYLVDQLVGKLFKYGLYE